MKFIKPVDYLYLFTRTVAIMASFIIGEKCSIIFHDTSHALGGMLAAISTVIIISDTDINDSLSMGWKRIVASFAGALIGFIYFLLFRFSLPGMAICIFIITLFTLLFSMKGYGRIATIVLIWMFIEAKMSHIPPFENGLMRFLESTLGVIIALISVWLLSLRSKKTK